MVLVGFWLAPALAQAYYKPDPVYTPEIRIALMRLITFQPTREQRMASLKRGEHKVEYHEALVLPVEIEQAQFRAMPPNANPMLYIGDFRYRVKGAGISEPGVNLLEFHISNWEQLAEGAPIILTVWPGGPRAEPRAFTHITPPRFHHDQIVDKRWTVFGGFVDEDASFELRHRATVPYAVVKIEGGGISLTTETSEHGWFSFYPHGIQLEKDVLYTVEILINEVALWSQTMTSETAIFPKWDIEIDPHDSTFYEIKGHVYDAKGAPLPGVTLTLDKHHTAITDENGSYRIIGLFAGNYILRASKKGYFFKPAKITGGQGKPVILDLVESKPPRLLGFYQSSDFMSH